MRINKVEELVGISKKNIRFYEEQGLLSPARNPENGYREYSDEEVAALRRIKLLRQLSVPIQEIRQLQKGILTLEDGMKRHMGALEREEEDLKQKKTICMLLKDEAAGFAALDARRYLEILEQKEREGVHFMNVRQIDKKKKSASIISAALMSALMLAVLGVMVWGMMVDPIPLPIVLVFMALPVTVIAGIMVALRQRMKEIEEGEEDEAGKY